MGMYYEAYVAFGILLQKPIDYDFELVESMDTPGTPEHEIMKKYGLKYLLAGNYDRDMLFLVTSSDSVNLGTYVMINSSRMQGFDYVTNSSRLLDGAEELGMEVLDGPGWILVPDLS